MSMAMVTKRWVVSLGIAKIFFIKKAPLEKSGAVFQVFLITADAMIHRAQGFVV
jgi:hypothetical protein